MVAGQDGRVGVENVLDKFGWLIALGCIPIDEHSDMTT